ncbi:MAG: toprim domain-containing protein [Clostridiaceae bacterium]|nr:toprim domain-containing protein [Clostridiaceae bacterium]
MARTIKPSYGNDSISSLKGADRVRKRPGVIFGSDSVEGCEHAFFEILSNSIDEAREGFGDRIHVTLYLDKSIEVEDFGRGIPLDYNEKEGRFNWELVYCELYAGGKYQNNEGESYEFSLGLNGLGACATQYASKYMDVTSYRDGFKYSLHFEQGENLTLGKDKLVKEPYSGKRTGTIQRFLPDIDVFTDISIPNEYFSDTIKKQAIVNPGLKFLLITEVSRGKFEEQEFCYQNGIVDYVTELSGLDALTSVQYAKTEKSGRDREDKPDYRVKVETAFCFCNVNPLIEYYHNSSFLEYGGAPDKAVRSAFVSAIDGYIRQSNKYQKSESKIRFNDISDSLILITNGFSTYTSYENQTKKSITNKFIQDMMTDFIRSTLEVYFIENRQEADKICEQVLINKRSREQAEKTRLNLKKKLSGGMDVTNRVQRFADCRTKDLGRREIYIVEGNSALGSCKQGRDPDFQAIMPIRGKILNCLKADYDKIFKSEIITDLIKVLGCGAEIKNKNKEMTTFDIENLRWNKIILCTDADVDGFQIRALLLTMLYRLTPRLIEDGYVYIAESPLFEIVCKGKSYFAYTEKERDEITKKLDGKKYDIMRSKGLGENEPDMMWETTMNPETRRLIRVLPSDAEDTFRMFDVLLGDNLSGRKDFISEYGYKYLDMADIS